MRHLAHDREVVCDEQVGEPAVALEVHQQVEHLRLHRHVERRHRLVAHHEGRLHRERARDADPLPLSAGKLVRIAPGVAGIEPDLFQQRRDPPRYLRSGRETMNLDALGHRGADPHARIERAVGILKHDLHSPPQLPQLGPAQPKDVSTVERRATRGRLLQSQNGPPDRGLPAPRLTDQTEGLSPANLERHAIHGAYRRTRTREQAPALVVLHQIGDLQQRLAHSRMPSSISQHRARCSGPAGSKVGSRTQGSKA